MKITEAHFGGLELYRGWDLSPLAAASGSLVADRFGLVIEMFRFDMRSSASAAVSEEFALGTWRKVQWHRG